MKDSMFDFSGMKCIITGGASGMGKIFAKALAERGAELVIADISVEGASQATDEILEAGGKAHAVYVNASDRASVDAMVKEATGYLGKVDLLLNSIGIGAKGKPGETYSDTWNRVLGVNLSGVYYCCEAVGELMIQERSGNIINIASMSATIVPAKTREGRSGEYGLMAYCASKGAVRQLTRAISALWAQYGIRANSISPGYVDTPLTQEPHSDSTIREKLEQSVPLGYLAKPEDIVSTVLYLASNASRYVTGTDILVDGGYTVK